MKLCNTEYFLTLQEETQSEISTSPDDEDKITLTSNLRNASWYHSELQVQGKDKGLYKILDDNGKQIAMYSDYDMQSLDVTENTKYAHGIVIPFNTKTGVNNMLHLFMNIKKVFTKRQLMFATIHIKRDEECVEGIKSEPLKEVNSHIHILIWAQSATWETNFYRIKNKIQNLCAEQNIKHVNYDNITRMRIPLSKDFIHYMLKSEAYGKTTPMFAYTNIKEVKDIITHTAKVRNYRTAMWKLAKLNAQKLKQEKLKRTQERYEIDEKRAETLITEYAVGNKQFKLSSRDQEAIDKMEQLQEMLRVNSITTFDEFMWQTDEESCSDLFKYYKYRANKVCEAIANNKMSDVKKQMKDLIGHIKWSTPWHKNSAWRQWIDIYTNTTLPKWKQQFNWCVSKEMMYEHIVEFLVTLTHITSQMTKDLEWNENTYNSRFLEVLIDIAKILSGTMPKKNTIYFYGSANAGKTLLLALMLYPFTAYTLKTGQTSGGFAIDGFTDNCYTVTGEELSIWEEHIQIFKLLFGGEKQNVASKHKTNIVANYRHPVFLTSNDHIYKDLTSENKVAMESRVITYKVRGQKDITKHIKTNNGLLSKRTPMYSQILWKLIDYMAEKDIYTWDTQLEQLEEYGSEEIAEWWRSELGELLNELATDYYNMINE